MYILMIIVQPSFFVTFADVPPCQSLDAALSFQSCNETCAPDTTISLSHTIFSLAPGVYHLSQCLGIFNATNVTFRSRDSSSDDVKIECATFPNDVVGNYDNLFVCGSEGIRFEGLLFRRCGPESPNVFLNYSSGIVFDRCTFT